MTISLMVTDKISIFPSFTFSPDTDTGYGCTMPLVLAIEISNPAAWTPAVSVRPGVAVGHRSSEKASFIAAESIDPTKPHDDDLMPAISRLFKTHNLSQSDITRIALSIGPGGFTATRIAVTTAKLIAEATGAQCVAVPSAFVAHAAANTKLPTLVALSTKGQTAHITRFDANGAAAPDPKIEDAATADLSGISLLLADTFAPQQLKERAAAAGITIATPVFDPKALLSIEHAFQPCSPIDLAPLYPREPEAVTKWRELKRQGRK